jgi:hypothetical protein
MIHHARPSAGQVGLPDGVKLFKSHWSAALGRRRFAQYLHEVRISGAEQRRLSAVPCVHATVPAANLRLAALPGNVRLARGEAGLPQPSVVNVSQMRTIDRTRLGERAGSIRPLTGGERGEECAGSVSAAGEATHEGCGVRQPPRHQAGQPAFRPRTVRERSKTVSFRDAVFDVTITVKSTAGTMTITVRAQQRQRATEAKNELGLNSTRNRLALRIGCEKDGAPPAVGRVCHARRVCS